MLKLSRYILIISSLLILNQKVEAQQAEANAGRNGIFVKLGNQLPKDFNYQLERKENTSWKTVYVSNFPKNITQLKKHLWSINGKNPFFKLPDSTELAFLYNQIVKYQLVDSIAIYNANPLFLEAMGMGYFDTEIKPGIKYTYRVTKLNNSGKKMGEQELHALSFPGKTPDFEVKNIRIVVQENRIGLYYYVSENPRPFGFRVFRKYTLQSSFEEINPTSTYFFQNDSLFLYVSDLSVAPKYIYDYVVQPYDDLGNLGKPSDTTLVQNVKKYTETPLLNNFKSVSLDEKKAIKLSWNFPTVNNLRNITVFRSSSFDNGYQPIASLKPSDTEFIDTRVAPVKTYYYYLVIQGAYGNSPASAKIAGMLKMSNKLSVAPQNIKIEQLTTGNKISWQKIEKETIGYYVYRSVGYRTELKQYSNMIYADSSEVSFIDSAKYLTKGQAYSYAIVAVNTNNQKSPISVRVIANPLKKELPTPLNLQVFKHAKGAFLIWEDMSKIDQHITGYQVFRSEFDDKGQLAENNIILNPNQLANGSNSFIDSTIKRGVMYTYAIKAIGIENSKSAPGNKVSFLLPEISPYPPSGLKAIGTKEGVFLQWDNTISQQVKSYKIYREKLGKKPKLIAEIDSKNTFYEDKLSDKATTWFYTISIVNSEGVESNRSDEVGINY